MAVLGQAHVGPQDGHFELLAGLTARLASTAKLDEIVETVLAEIVRLGFGAVWMAVLDESSGQLATIKEVIDGVDTTHVMPLCKPDPRQPVGHGFRERRMINVTDPSTLHIMEKGLPVPSDKLALPRTMLEHLRGRPFSVGPLLGSRGQPVGALGLSAYLGGQPIPDEMLERGLLHAFMHHLGIAMERAIHTTRLERLNQELLEAYAAIASSARIKAVGELAAAVAHDLNNLSGIALLAVSAGKHSPKAALDVLPRIERANRTIGELVGRLQRIARQAHPADDVAPAACPHEIVEDILAMISPLLRERAIEVDLALLPCPPVRSDPSFLRQLVLNLVLNAQDALEEVSTRQRRLRIVVRGDGDMVRLEVSDNGPGIASDVLPRLFEPFVTTKQGAHAGLGLAAAAGTLKHFGGAISGRNQPGSGAIFEVTLPSASVHDMPKGEPSYAAPVVESRRGSILAVDDDEDILIVVRAYLDSLGYEVVTTLSAEEALRAVPERTFDLVLCDVGMPRHNGLDLCQLLRDNGYRGKIVLMTGWDTQRVNGDRRAQSCDAVLKKPFLGTELIQLIDTMLVSA